MQKSTTKSRKIAVIAICISVILGISSIFSFGLFNAPTWNDIFRMSGISDINGNIQNYKLQVHFLDVGKADCILIKCGNDDILIDAGDVDPKNTVVQYLQRQKTENLDLIVNTHPDRDHIGQMANVIYEFNVDKFVYSYLPDDFTSSSSACESMQFALYNRNVPTEEVKAGDDLSMNDMKISVLGPVTQDKDDTNNNSIVLKLTYGNDKFLFMGDAEKKEEKEIINSGADLKANLIKIGHHGSASSTTDKLLSAVLPGFAVICTGGNSTKFPKQSTLDKLSENKVKVYRTDENGNTVAATNGNGIKIFTQK